MTTGDHVETPLGDILGDLSVAAEDGVTVNGLLAHFDDRPGGVLYTVFGLIAAIPVVGAIPGVSIAMASMVLLVVLRVSTGGGRLRLPAWLGGNIDIPEKTLRDGIGQAEGTATRIDNLVTRRCVVLVETSASRALIRITVGGLALTMFPLAFVPWGVLAPALGIVAFGLATLARDGLLALAGYTAMIGTVASFVWML